MNKYGEAEDLIELIGNREINSEETERIERMIGIVNRNVTKN